MNIFTRFLSGKNKPDKELERIVTLWDELEALVIRVFKGKQAVDHDRERYVLLQAELRQLYPKFEAQLDSIWRLTLVGGQPAPEDPFRRLFHHPAADDFVGDWVAMQNLAAAREALNRLVANVHEGTDL